MAIKERLAALIASKIGDRGRPVNANQVHKATGVPQSTLSRILSGEVTDVRERRLKKLAVYFETTPAAVRDESVDMPKPVPNLRTSADRRSPSLPSFEFAALRASQTASELLTTYNNATSEEDRAVIIAVVAAPQRQLTADQSKKKR